MKMDKYILWKVEAGTDRHRALIGDLKTLGFTTDLGSTTFDPGEAIWVSADFEKRKIYAHLYASCGPGAKSSEYKTGKTYSCGNSGTVQNQYISQDDLFRTLKAPSIFFHTYKPSSFASYLADNGIDIGETKEDDLVSADRWYIRIDNNTNGHECYRYIEFALYAKLWGSVFSPGVAEFKFKKGDKVRITGSTLGNEGVDEETEITKVLINGSTSLEQPCYVVKLMCWNVVESDLEPVFEKDQPKFKVGDRVKITSGDRSLGSVGSLSTGGSKTHVGWCYNIMLENGDERAIYDHNIELVTEEKPKPMNYYKFNVGDSVEVLSDTREDKSFIGSIGVIKSRSRGFPRTMWNLWEHPKSNLLWHMN